MLGIELLLLIPWDLYCVLRWVLVVATDVRLSVEKSPRGQWDSGFLLSAVWCFTSCRIFFHPLRSTWCVSLRKVISDSKSPIFCCFVWSGDISSYNSRYLGGSLCQFALTAAADGPSGSAHPTFPGETSSCIGNSDSDWHDHCLSVAKKCYPAWDLPGDRAPTWPLRSTASNS